MVVKADNRRIRRKMCSSTTYQLHVKIPGIERRPLQTEAMPRPMSQYIVVHTEVIMKRIPSFAAVSKSQQLQSLFMYGKDKH
jgi:hypothetical protein